MVKSSQRSYRKNGNLFPLATRFRIAEIGQRDARQTTDNLQTLESLILANENMYPGIDHWFRDKVIPGLKSNERIAYIAYEEERPIASAVLKLGRHAKFCHLKIHEDFQDLDLGRMFFTQMTLEARHYASEIHFTLPESLWSSKGHFFESFGFKSPAKAHQQYRTGDTELSCSAPLATVWEAALNHLLDLTIRFSPRGFSSQKRILMSIRPKYVDRIITGAKDVEVRRRFSDRWLGCRAVLYGSNPLSSLVGEATISAINRDTPDRIWSSYGPRLGAELKEFEQYAGSNAEVSAIEFTDVTPYMAPIGLTQLSHLINSDLHPPQSFCDLRLDSTNPWAKATAVATLLHGRF
jgi:predicted transcriptional regulator